MGEGRESRGGPCQAPRLRAGRPAIQLSRRSPVSRALRSPGTSEPMGSGRGGRPGAAEPMSEADRARGLSGGPAVGVGVGSLAWPTPAGGRIRGAPGTRVRVRGARAGARGRGGAEVRRSACAAVAGTGRPVAMATAGASRVAPRGSPTPRGRRLACLRGGGWGGSSPLHLVEFPGTSEVPTCAGLSGFPLASVLIE